MKLLMIDFSTYYSWRSKVTFVIEVLTSNELYWGIGLDETAYFDFQI